MTKKSKETPKPSEYMRDLRPHLFSDSEPEVPRFEKAFLEYHLDSLTARREEAAFEAFARRLAEVELCPNLRPQTGPTGGGDSHVDAGTYPVSPELALRAYWGSIADPTPEEWAFAFSAKKTWKTKAASDIEKIASVDPKPKRAYFVTNQNARDKDRKKLENSLSSKYGMDVRILDLQWIVAKVIASRRDSIVAETLNIPTGKPKPRPGKNDYARELELEAVLSRLSDPARYRPNDYALAQDYLVAAALSRGLEKPRAEVEAFYAKAESLAVAVGDPSQIIGAAYDNAWTAYWWYDDAETLLAIYARLEVHLPALTEAEDVENLGTLLHVLSNGFSQGVLGEARTKIADRRDVLRAALARIAADDTRPTNALHAESLLCFEDIRYNLFDPTRCSASIAKLPGLLKRAQGHGTYPASRFMNFIFQLGEFFGDSQAYERAFQELHAISAKRQGDIEAGRLAVRRAEQLVQAGNCRQAIPYFGKARVQLWKDATMREAIRASILCAAAYFDISLPWAARLEALLAIRATLRSAESQNEYAYEAARAAIMMCDAEMLIGRLSPYLVWYQFALMLVHKAQTAGVETERLESQLRDQDGLLGCLILNLPERDLQTLGDIPPVLERLGLVGARCALLHARGELGVEAAELPRECRGSPEKTKAAFLNWRNQPAAETLPKQLVGERRLMGEYSTTLLGVRFVATVRNQIGAQLFAENLIGMFEAALALARWEHLAIVVDSVEFTIDVSDDAGHTPPPFSVDRAAMPEPYSLVFGPDALEWQGVSNRETVGKYLRTILLKVVADITIDPVEDVSAEFDWWENSGAFDRALGFCPTATAVTDTVGVNAYDFSASLKH